MAGVSSNPDPCVVEGDTRLSPFGWAEVLLTIEAFPATLLDDLRYARRVTVIASGLTITVRHGHSGRGDVIVVAGIDSAVITCGRFSGKPVLRLPFQRRTIQHPTRTLRIRLQSADLAMFQRFLDSAPPVES